MQLRIAKIGRVAYPELTAMAAVYEGRLKPFGKVEALDFKDEDGFLRFAAKLAPGTRVVMMDERGKCHRSTELAERLRAWTDDPAVKQVLFVIGGPLGLGEGVKALAQETWSLSAATFTSDFAWVLCWEQLYRAFTILKGTGYHHD